MIYDLVLALVALSLSVYIFEKKYFVTHAINAVKFWLRKHGATASEVPVYVSDIRDLFHQENNYVWGTQAEILIWHFLFWLLGPSL